MIHLNDYDGLPPLPLPVDDELITAAGAFPQPEPYTSYMSGFNACVQLFPVLASCMVRHRRLQLRLRAGGVLQDDEVDAEMRWADETRHDLDALMNGLPAELAGTLSYPGAGDDAVRDAILGMQRANILITEASVRIALFDYVADLAPMTPQMTEERSELARRAYETLSNIPIDDLAANGESIVSLCVEGER